MTDFDGFGPKALPFLKALGFHQNREWFQENRDLYLSQVKQPLGDLVEHLSERFEKAGLPFRGNRKTCLFRVNRDVRFAKEKHPYNTHASAVLTRTASKRDHGLLYVHVSNERTFIAAGFYGLDTELLTAMRRRIVDHAHDYFQIVNRLKDHGLTDESTESLKRNPRGFETVSDERLQSAIRLKHQTVAMDLPSELVTKPDLADKLFWLGEAAMPLLNYGWRAIDPILAERANADQ